MWLLAQKYQIVLAGNTILKRLDSERASDVKMFGWTIPLRFITVSKLFQDAPLLRERPKCAELHIHSRWRLWGTTKYTYKTCITTYYDVIIILIKNRLIIIIRCVQPWTVGQDVAYIAVAFWQNRSRNLKQFSLKHVLL